MPPGEKNYRTFNDLPEDLKAALTAPTCLFDSVEPDERERPNIIPITLKTGDCLWRQGDHFRAFDHGCLRVIASGRVSVIYTRNDRSLEVGYGAPFVIGEVESYIGYDISPEGREKNEGAMVDYRNQSGQVEWDKLPYTIVATEPTTLLIIYDFFQNVPRKPTRDAKFGWYARH